MQLKATESNRKRWVDAMDDTPHKNFRLHSASKGEEGLFEDETMKHIMV